MTNDDGNDNAPTLIQVFLSVLGSFFGVQSNERRQHDFKHGKASQFIAVGLILTLVFVLTIWGIVSLVLKFTLN